jgi:hypothetical protein
MGRPKILEHQKKQAQAKAQFTPKRPELLTGQPANVGLCH